MGRIKNGILGGFSGKVGAVVGASWRGIDYIRALPSISTKPASKAQLAQRAKMILLRGFLLGMDEIIERCFQNLIKHTPMNDALSYNILNSVEGSYPDQTINFNNLLYSKGDLIGAWSPKVNSIQSNSIDFTWDHGIFHPMCAAEDEVIVVVYDPVKMEFCRLENAAIRSEKALRLIVPPTFKGNSVHCYISFYSKSRNIASTNEYLGTVKVQ